MLKRVSPVSEDGAMVRIADAKAPAPFVSGLEYGAPARGVWNIVHVGMLIPGAHEIYVCAGNCLRGVVLTAAEMGAQRRFSTITIKENNVLDGDMERLLIDGVTDILTRLPSLPPAVLVYTSCIHHFLGCDLALCYRELRSRFPGVDFTDCYMNPILRKSGLTPDQLMRKQLYSLLKPRAQDAGVNILGNCFETDETSELVKIIRLAKRPLRDITQCRTYEDYQQMAASTLHIAYNPPAKAGGQTLANRLGGTFLYLPLSYTPQVIRRNLQTLCTALDVTYDARAAGAAARKSASGGYGNCHRLHRDTRSDESGALSDRARSARFAHLRRLDCRRRSGRLPLAAGARAGSFAVRNRRGQAARPAAPDGAPHACHRAEVNIVEGGGMYGFDGICRLCARIEEAFLTARDPRNYIQQKGLGCESCL